VIIDNLASVTLSAASPHRRSPPRPLEGRQADYMQRFDDRTLLYDLFYNQSGEMALAIAPPLLNLREAWERTKVISFEKNVVKYLRNLDRVDRIWISAPLGTEFYDVISELDTFKIPVSANCGDMFKGKRVLMTASRDNSLSWIRDWATFNVNIHGANSIIFYDNASTAYELRELDLLLSQVPGIELVVIISWPFKWGPSGAGSQWDSNFCQLAAWEHARWRFLQSARSVLNSDIDELVIASNGRSVFELTEESDEGYLRFPGRWISNASDSISLENWQHRRHLNFTSSQGVASVETKWCVVPWRTPNNAQWGAHSISLMKAPENNYGLCYRHFRAISTSWKYDRGKPVPFDAAQCVTDEELRSALRSAFVC